MRAGSIFFKKRRAPKAKKRLYSFSAKERFGKMACVERRAKSN